MADTTVLEETTIINEGVPFGAPSVSWGAIVAGALIAVATTLFLLLLGAGFGLMLVSHNPGETPTFLTLGGVYFLAAQAFGLAAGAHVTGRLIGPAIETAPEEEFRAASHGLAAWALAVLLTVGIAALSAAVAEGAALGIGALYGVSPAAKGADVFPATTSYWVDVLFRPATANPAPQRASLDGVQYAQNDNGSGNDASTAPPPAPAAAEPPQQDETAPAQTDQAPSGPSDQTTMPRGPRNEIVAPSGPAQAPTDNGVSTSTLPPTQAPSPTLNADKEEAGRILDAGLAGGGLLSTDDRDRIAQLVAQDAAVSYEEATMRVNKVQSQIHDEQRGAAQTVRRTASHASLWIAFALLFGAIVSAVAAVSARWEDDMQAMFRFGRAAPLE
jgi:hypothetical protein